MTFGEWWEENYPDSFDWFAERAAHDAWDTSRAQVAALVAEGAALRMALEWTAWKGMPIDDADDNDKIGALPAFAIRRARAALASPSPLAAAVQRVVEAAVAYVPVQRQWLKGKVTGQEADTAEGKMRDAVDALRQIAPWLAQA